MVSVEKYRSLITATDLVSTRVRLKESDLLIRAERECAFPVREDIEFYLESHPGFRQNLVPVFVKNESPLIVREMAKAALLCGVGPITAVAGVLAYFVGRGIFRPDLSFNNFVN